jgi:hypothetical protein
MRCVLCPAIVLVLLFGGVATADPISMVTSGAIVFTDEPGLFQIRGSDFDVDVGWWPMLVSGTPLHDHCASGCSPGTAIDFGTNTYAFSDLFQGFGGTVNGVMYSQLFKSGEVTFEGPEIIAPSFDGTHVGIATGPFSFHGRVAIFTDASRTGPPVFARELTGRGTATALGDFLSPSSLFYFDIGDLKYAFSSPVPEPTSLVLLGTGVLGIVGLRRCRRKA